MAKQKFGEAKSPFKMNGHTLPGINQRSPAKQTKKKEKPAKQTKKKEKKIDDLADVLGLIPGSEHVFKTLHKTREKFRKSKFAQKYLIVDPKKTKLSKIGKFIKKHTE
jgi:hypothetical protein